MNVNLKVQERAAGQKILEDTLKNLAVNFGERKNYLSSSAYGNNVWRVSNIAMTKAWYGVNYTKYEDEECKHPLNETFRPKLTGIEVQNKKMDATQKLDIKLKPGEDYIIVYRQTEMKCEA